MIRYLKYEHIDKQKWDACVDQAFNGSIYVYSWYLDVVCEEWEGLVEGDYDRVFPINFRRKWGINIIYQPFFTQQLGVVSKTELSPEVINAFLEAIPGKFKVADLNLNTLNSPDLAKFTYNLQINYELDLISDYEKLKENYSSNARRNLVKAEKENLSLVKGIKPDMVIKLFRENRGQGISVLREENYRRLKRLIYTAIYKGMASVYGVYDSDNNLCAGAIFLESNRKSTFIFSGLSEEGREKRAMFFLIDNFIRENAGRHLTLDFDGSNDEALARFYAGFGSTRITFPRIHRNTLPLHLKWAYTFYHYLRSR